MRTKYYYDANKIDKAYVTVRDYNLNACYNAGMDLVIRTKKGEMTVPYEEMRERALRLDERSFGSHYSATTYKVYHFKWKADEKVDKNVPLPM